MAADYTIKQNDQGGVIRSTLADENGVVNLGTATQVLLRMTQRVSGTTKTLTAAVADAAGGIVSYTWQASDLAEAGTYDAEFEVTFAGGKIDTFPSMEYNEIEVTPELG